MRRPSADWQRERERDQVGRGRENIIAKAEKGAVRRHTCGPTRRVAIGEWWPPGLWLTWASPPRCSLLTVPHPCQRRRATQTPSRCGATSRSAPASPTTEPADGGGVGAAPATKPRAGAAGKHGRRRRRRHGAMVVWPWRGAEHHPWGKDVAGGWADMWEVGGKLGFQLENQCNLKRCGKWALWPSKPRL
jgi:hypothetical protein